MSGSSGRQLQGSPYTGDDGSADPRLTAALASYDAGGAGEPDVLALLAQARLLVPVVALLGEVEYGADGLARDKSSDMAAVLLTGADGRRALLAFTDSDALRRWNADARPVPVSTVLAAQTALQERADAVVVDVAGPVRFVLNGPDLERIATGWRPVRLPDGGWAWLGATDTAEDEGENEGENA